MVRSMDAKKFLMQYADAEARARQLQEQIDYLRERRDELQGFQMQERVQTSLKPDKIGDLVARIADLQLDLIEAEADALQVMTEVRNVIDKVTDPTCRLLLHRRYVLLIKWSAIADEMHYSYTGIMAVHRRALEKVEKLI